MMSSVVKKSFQYLYESNKRLIMLSWVGAFVVMPFLIFVTLYNSTSDISGSENVVYFMSCILCFAYIIYFTIYMYRFLSKKQSCDLYFSLPIERKTLFLVLTGFIFLVSVLPIIINYILALLIIMFMQSELNMYQALFTVLPTILLIGFATQMLISVLCIKCNNMVDTIFITGSYLVLPYIIMFFISVLLNSLYGEFMLGNGNYESQLMLSDSVLSVLSAPYALSNILSTALETSAYIWWIAIYYVVIGVLCFVLSYRFFMKRKAEDSEQRTTMVLGYPLIILLITVCLLLNISTIDNIIVLVLLALTFLLYIFMVFMYRRTTKLNWNSILIFLGMCVLSFAFAKGFVAVKGFNIINEEPNLSKVTDVYVSINFNNDKDEAGDLTSSNYVMDSENTVAIEKIVELQKEIMSGISIENRYDMGGNYDQIYLEYSGPDYLVIRYYTISDKNIDKVKQLFNELKNQRNQLGIDMNGGGLDGAETK